MKLTHDTHEKFEAYTQRLSLGANMPMAASVLLFMAAFDQPIVLDDQKLTEADFELARKLMREEIDEMWEGFDQFKKSKTLENKTAFVDGAIDTIYVVLWSLLKMGVPVDACFDEVQRSNMAKLQADGTCLKNEAGKVQKPEGWTPPDLFGILKDFQVNGLYKNGWRHHGNETTQSQR